MPANGIKNLLEHKKEAKAEMCRELSLSKTKPLVGIFLDKEPGNLQMILEGMTAVDCEVVILTDMDFDDKRVLSYSRENRSKLMSAADIALIFDFTDVEELLLNGVVPVSPARAEVEDYNPNKETGNSFVYKNKSAWGVFAALVRAIETFKFPYDWKHIVRQAVESVKELA